MNEEDKKSNRQCRNWKQKRKRSEKKNKENKENREKWIAELKSDHKHLLDTSIAEKGQVWNSHLWLSRELDRDSGFRHVTNWQGLIPVFGESVAKAFRDGAIDYWRKHTPKLKSEVDDNSIYHSTTLGLSGIGMEYQLHGNRLLKSLSSDEAKLSTRYATKEFNGFSHWFHDLFAEFPSEVKQVLLGEIEWEIAIYKGDHPPHHVLNSVNYHAKWIRKHIADEILASISNNQPASEETVTSALTLILSSENISSEKFVAVAKSKVQNKNISNSEKALWFTGWISMSANDGVEELDTFISNLSDKETITEFMMSFITSLINRHSNVLEGLSNNYCVPSILSKLIKLTYKHIRIEDDIDRRSGEAYSPTLRDNAQDSRGILLSKLAEIPGKQTYLELKLLERSFTSSWMQQRCTVLSKTTCSQ